MEYTLHRGKLKEDQFVNNISIWLSRHPNIRISKMYTDENTSIGIIVNKSVLSTVTFIYEEDDSINNSYGFDILEKFSLMKIGIQAMKDKWHALHPDCEIVTCNYIHNARGQTGSLMLNGVGASNRNQLRVVYKRKLPNLNSQNAVAAPCVATQSPVLSFCTNCGSKILPENAFCGNCGKKLH